MDYLFRNLLKIGPACGLAILISSGLSGQRLYPGMGPLLDRAEVKQGERIPADLPIFTTSGEKRSLADVTDGKYTVLVSGCLTCPIFHRTYSGVEAVYHDYKDRSDFQFFYIYKSLAHPEYNGYIQPITLEERLAHIDEAKRVLGTRVEWLSDGMDNRVRHTLGLGPNTQIIIDPHGEIIHSLGWSDAAVLRDELVDAVGASPTTTEVADLNLDRQAPYRSQRAYTEGVLEKPTFNSELVAVKVQPIVDGNEPLYVKPRLEVASSVLNEGAGELYLGFFLDPIHDVHWNNLAAPLKYELTSDDGTFIEPASQAAPKVEQGSDDDPREFALKVTQLGNSRKAELAIHYFACSKDEGWCRPVTQKYAVSFEIDPDGGGTNGRSFRVGGGGRRGPGPRPRNANRLPQGGRGQGIEEMRERIRNMDSNGDGLISLDEAPQGMQQQFPNMDLDSSGSLDDSEIESMLGRRFPQRGPGGARQPQGLNPRSVRERILNSDANGDRRITIEELPQQLQRRFQQMDANSDGSVDGSEIDEMLRNRPSPQTQPKRRPGSGQI